MTVEVVYDSNGLERVDFYRMLQTLVTQDRVFDKHNIRYIPYDQLVLCCTGSAFAARCSIQLIRAEKQARRRRFLGMSPADLAEARRYLIAEGMLPDIERLRQLAQAPSWQDLTTLQKLWFKLICLERHADEPFARMVEARELLLEAEPQLGKATAKMRETILRFMFAETTPLDRSHAFALMAAKVQTAMDQVDRTAYRRLLLRDYNCTSDCFEPVVQQGG